MKKITQSIEYEGISGYTGLHSALKEFHIDHPFQTGVDWQFQYMWAILEDEDCLAFCLKHPQFAHRFTTV